MGIVALLFLCTYRKFRLGYLLIGSILLLLILIEIMLSGVIIRLGLNL